MVTPVERALSHPSRIAILDHLARVDLASDRQIAEAVKLAIATAAYHLRVLKDAQMVKSAGTFLEAGTAQLFYEMAIVQ